MLVWCVSVVDLYRACHFFQLVSLLRSVCDIFGFLIDVDNAEALMAVSLSVLL